MLMSNELNIYISIRKIMSTWCMYDLFRFMNVWDIYCVSKIMSSMRRLILDQLMSGRA